MGADLTGPWSDGPDTPDGSGRAAEQYGTRPLGRQYGTRPAEPRQYGTRPERQYGTRPERQYGTRPERQYGTRPERQYGTRPYPDDLRGQIDPEEWSADVADLFCAYSAVVRLGAHFVFSENEVPVPTVPFAAATSPNYVPQGGNMPRANVGRQPLLRPRRYTLATTVEFPNDLLRDLLDHPDSAWAVKDDMATALALRADQAFLRGNGANEPFGVARRIPGGQQASSTLRGPGLAPTPDLLATARNMVGTVRSAAVFRNAGWVLHPGALSTLSGTVTGSAQRAAPPVGDVRSLDATALLTYDGRDGGQFLGYPFVVSTAAGSATSMFFSADWAEAWVGVYCDWVTIDASSGTGFGTDSTVIRAVMRHDFRVRSRAAFRYT
jgi:HK97 family phage major capsid protein